MNAGKLGVTLGSVLLAALAAAGCDRPATVGSATNNTGNSASTSPERLQPSTTVAAAPTGDTASPNSTAASGNVSSGMAETATTGKIKAALAADSGLRESDIKVSTENGVVTLSGSVKSQEQATVATQLAQRQEGVTRVQNDLAVR